VASSELLKRGHKVSHQVICKILKEEGNYSLQANKKTSEGNQHIDRDAQFIFINKSLKKAMAKGQPVLSVDAKKKENIGNYKNNGTQWRKSGNPLEVNGHDFCKVHACPYGIYDLLNNKGFVNVGTNHDTATFAVNSIRGWWVNQGRKLYPNIKYLTLTADCGGSNGNRLKLWKFELQKLADELKVPIKVHHLPPGTSKWNKVEHRLFAFISSSWRGQPLVDYKTVVKLISHTTTATGLKVTCRLDRRQYRTGRKVTDAEMKTLNIIPNDFHGEWNYILKNRTLHM
jgi:hypothetical protein